LVYESLFTCDDCGFVHAERRTLGHPVLSLHARCPKCARYDVKKLVSRDEVDPFYWNPLFLIQALFGAPLLYCAWCRIQFYDLRPRRRRRIKPEEPAERMVEQPTGPEQK
jgi:hypothetical protein